MYSEWKENGVNITVGSGYSVNGTVLTISNLSTKNNGNTITCRALEDRRMISAESSAFVLNVLYGPDHVQATPSGNLTVSEGGKMNITCTGECNPPCSTYQWHKDSQSTVVGSSQSYSMPDVRRNHSGVYICAVTNTNISKSATTHITVKVNYPPTISIESRNGSVSETGLMINCSAHGIPERYTYSLIHSSLFSGIKIQQLIDNEPVSTGVFVHWFRNPSFMDTGVYTCIVSNGILDYRDGSLDKNVSRTVWITGPPNVTSSDRDFYAEKGDSGRLYIEFYNSLLDASVTWNKKGNQTLEKLESFHKYNISVDNTTVGVKFYSVLIQQPGFITTLDIKNVTEEDFCEYKVLLQNSVGNLSDLTLHLRPRESNKQEITDTVIIGGAVVLLSIMVAVVGIILYRRKRVQKPHSDGTPLELGARDVIRGVAPTGGNNIISNEYESLQNDREGDNPYQELQDLSAVNEDIDSRSDARRLILQTAGNNTTSNEYESPRSCRAEVHSYLELQDIPAGPREEATARGKQFVRE